MDIEKEISDVKVKVDEEAADVKAKVDEERTKY